LTLVNIAIGYWKRLVSPPTAATAEEIYLAFRLLHDILPLKGRLSRFRVEEDGHCRHCPCVIETASHFFTACHRVQDIWPPLVSSLVQRTGPQSDEALLMLAWPPVARDKDIVAAIVAYVHLVWIERGHRCRPSLAALISSGSEKTQKTHTKTERTQKNQMTVCWDWPQHFYNFAQKFSTVHCTVVIYYYYS
jgi:zinc-binding in reverse transcriptase